MDSFNNLVGQFAEHKPVLDKALKTIPDALAVLKNERDKLGDALDATRPMQRPGRRRRSNRPRKIWSKNSAISDRCCNRWPTPGMALTRGLDYLTVPLFPKPPVAKWIRGDYGNFTAVFDLTLSRIDSSFFTGTRWEGNLTELELQWGRTLGVMPSPYTARNPLVAPYHFNQGP